MVEKKEKTNIKISTVLNYFVTLTVSSVRDKSRVKVYIRNIQFREKTERGYNECTTVDKEKKLVTIYREAW